MTTFKEMQLENLKLSKTIYSLEKDISYLQNIMHDLPGITYWKDTSGRYLGCNQFAIDSMKKLGITKTSKKAEVIGKTDWDLFDNATATQYRKNDQIVINEKKTLTRQELLNLSSGKVMHLLSIKRPLYGEDGNIIGIIGTSIDITYQKLAEEREKLALNQGTEAINKTNINQPIFAENIKKYFSKFLKTDYLIKIKNQIPFISTRAYENLLIAYDDIAQIAFTATNFLMINSPQIFDKKTFLIYPLKYCINEVIRCNSNTNKMKLNGNVKEDFLIYGNKLLIIHVLYNLLTTPLYYGNESQNIPILIWTEGKADFNILHIKHTTNESIKENNFKKESGLVFCERAMEALGGRIFWCSAKEHIEFILYFPLAMPYGLLNAGMAREGK